MSSLLTKYLKKTKNPYSYLLTQKGPTIREYIDTGNYALNALISGDIHKGIPTGKVIEFAGPESTGKTYFTIDSVIQAQKMGYTILYYDTEFANTAETFIERGINPEMFVHSLISDIRELKTDILNFLDLVDVDNDRTMIVVDSLGNLTSTKEVSDAMSDDKKKNATKDMTKPGELKALCRTMTIPAAVKNVPIILVNHVYANIGGYGPPTTQGGGCLTENQKILMEDESTRLISEVKIGDIVKTLNEPSVVVNTYQYKQPIIKLTLSNGSTINATKEHKFLVEIDGHVEWKEVDDLDEGDEIVSIL